VLKNTLINRAVTKKIATALGPLNEQVVYVGGAVVSLYIDDPSANDVRPTKDLDLTMKIASLSELRIVEDIDAIVRVVRFPGWQQSTQGEREVQSSLRKIIWAKYKIKDQVLFDRAYAYIKEYY